MEINVYSKTLALVLRRLTIYIILNKIMCISFVNGTDKMTMEEIDAEIAAYRKEKSKN